MAPPVSGMSLSFAEDFNSLQLYSRWKPHDQWGNRYLHGNNELQRYVDPQYKGLGLNPFSINNGVLTIKAAKAGANASKVGAQYTSGMLSSHGSFSQQYGYFEMRAQLPAGKGMWPAFWLLADHGKWPPELDIMESIGSKPYYAVQSIHSRDGNSGKTTTPSENLQAGFHTYGMNWSKDKISYYIDGKKTYERATPSDMHTKMHILVNTAVGGKWPGSPDGTTDWSKTNYKIDYIRVYKQGGSGITPPADNTPPVGNTPPANNPPPVGGSGSDSVVFTNTMNVKDYWDHYKVKSDGPNTSRTYTAGQMQIGGVSDPTTVSVWNDNENDLFVQNNGAWGTIRNATVRSAAGDVTIRDFVDAEMSLGDKSRTITLTNVKRGNLTTGNGNDVFNVTGHSDSDGLNLLTINTGGGWDAVNYTGESDNRVRINTGWGNDTVTVSGGAPATVDAGSGTDRINVRTDNGVRVTGGTGRDVFSFIANAHATIADYKWADDRIELKGVSANDVKVHASGGNTYIDLGGTGRITVAGVTHTAAGLHLSYA